ncbi:unnamed protein product [Rotaria socialis]
MTRDNESPTASTNIHLKKNYNNPQNQALATGNSTIVFNNSTNCNPKKCLRQESSEIQSSPPNISKLTRTTITSDSMEIVHKTAFPPYSITLKNSQHNEQLTDCKLVEHLILEWKNKNRSELDITGRFGHEKRILIFANNETTFEELLDQHKWPDKIADDEFELKVLRIFPSAYSLVIQQFYNGWNINEVQDELKIIYSSLIKLTKMHSFNNKPLNLVRADFCSLE